MKSNLSPSLCDLETMIIILSASDQAVFLGLDHQPNTLFLNLLLFIEQESVVLVRLILVR